MYNPVRSHAQAPGEPKVATRRRDFLWKPDDEGDKLLQVYSRGLEFSLVSNSYEQCHRWVLCKDFLHDVVYSVVRGQPVDIFKFRYDPSKDPKCCMRETRLLIGHRRDSSFRSRLPSMLDFLNQVESRLGMKSSELVEPSTLPEGFRDAVMVRGSKRWLRSPPMLSLYALLVRVGMGHRAGDAYKTTIRNSISSKPKPYQPKDGKWLRIIEPALHKIMRFGDRRLFRGGPEDNYPEMDLEVVHNRLGIVGFAYDMAIAKLGRKVPVPAWHAIK